MTGVSSAAAVPNPAGLGISNDLPSTSPPLHGIIGSKPPIVSSPTMTLDSFSPLNATSPTLGVSYSSAFCPIGLPVANNMASHFSSDADLSDSTSILIRKLSPGTSDEGMRNMFIFAGRDFIDVKRIPTDIAEDGNFLTAVAHFKTSVAAHKAQSLLDGKLNPGKESNLIVEMWYGQLATTLASRRSTFDNNAVSHSLQMSASAAAPLIQTRQTSRFNGTFQNMERPHSNGLNLANGIVPANDDLSSPESDIPYHNLMYGLSGLSLSDRSNNVGKSVISQDVPDDETNEILKNPVEYALSGAVQSSMPISRRSAKTQVPVSRHHPLSLATQNVTSPPMSYASPRSAMSLHTGNPLSPTALGNLGQNQSFQYNQQSFHMRPNYPPVNPADQNPPCNTLYVGNLPLDTSEDELKAMFSKQRGYKRLCFRTKANGPMCFVEFEDISYATKALNDLYGVCLHNSVKGGIRLSFSKNPLGVRNGQPGSMASATSLAAQSHPGVSTGYGAVGASQFATASGPPPGIPAPPGLTQLSINNLSGLTGSMNNQSASTSGYFGKSTGLGINSMQSGLNSVRLPTTYGSSQSSNVIGSNIPAYADYLAGHP